MSIASYAARSRAIAVQLPVKYEMGRHPGFQGVLLRRRQFAGASFVTKIRQPAHAFLAVQLGTSNESCRRPGRELSRSPRSSFRSRAAAMLARRVRRVSAFPFRTDGPLGWGREGVSNYFRERPHIQGTAARMLTIQIPEITRTAKTAEAK